MVLWQGGFYADKSNEYRVHTAVALGNEACSLNRNGFAFGFFS